MSMALHSGGIFLMTAEKQPLVEMAPQRYDSEEVLQLLLARYPNLLAGDQMDSDAPRRWLLVGREASVPSDDSGAARWSADHLFLDQDGVPTIVEVKRSTDTRIRREVVGQMLDYAANALLYWPVERMESLFQESCRADGRDPESALTEYLTGEIEVPEYWQRVKTNLQAGRLRMVFVADDIPSELRSIVEFLNAQMDPAEVFAVEIRQYAANSLKAFVPRVFGQTARSQQAKGAGDAKRLWDEPMLIEAIRSRFSEREAHTAQELLQWARTKGLRLAWGTGPRTGSCAAQIPAADGYSSIWWIYTYGHVVLPLRDLLDRAASVSVAAREDVLRRVAEVAGEELPRDRPYPGIRLSALADDMVLKRFITFLEWLVAEFTTTNPR